MGMFLTWLACAVLVGLWANKWGRSGAAWGLGAAIFSPMLAALFLAVAGQNVEGAEANRLAAGDLRRCPFCAELIKREARVCKHCARDIEPFSFPPGPWVCAACKVENRDEDANTCANCGRGRVPQ